VGADRSGVSERLLYKYQRGLEYVDEAKRKEMKEFTYELIQELYDLELKYSGELYEPLGLMDDVAIFVRYNANKALMNLGYPNLFPHEECQVNPKILAARARLGREPRLLLRLRLLLHHWQGRRD